VAATNDFLVIQVMGDPAGEAGRPSGSSILTIIEEKGNANRKCSAP